MAKATLAKTYDPKTIEPALYQRWERSGYFNPDKLPGKRTKRFTIAMPPPNVTGDLHIGHAFEASLQDALIRYHRMNGEASLWVPGVDHAGIATQVKVERMLAEMNLSRHDIGREAFLTHAWKWKEKYGDTIARQIRSLGASCDWSRERFTMDPGLTEAVHEAFARLYEQGLIYRGERIINWCPKDQTGLSDLEVVYKEMPAKLYRINYGLLTVATQRPETMLGDTAIAVNPKDARYRALVGKTVVVPLTGREVPIVADVAVDPNFGTGAVKVTPAHDPLDWEIGQRHALARIEVIGKDGFLTAAAGEFAGLDVMAARKRIVSELEAEGLLVSVEDYVTKLPLCDRCRTVIEPLVSEQWFLDVKPMAAQAIAAVRAGKIQFVPARFTKTFFHWMENIRDWNISRQLWWGHRIPVWTRVVPRSRAKTWDLEIHGATIAMIADGRKRYEIRAGRKPGSGKDLANVRVGDRIRFTPVEEKSKKPLTTKVVIRRVAGIQTFESLDHLLARIPLDRIHPGMNRPAYERFVAALPNYPARIRRFGLSAFELAPEEAEVRETAVSVKKPTGQGWEREEDTLDTWFSSGLWTFSTLGWPKETRDLARFHPTDVMMPAWDILFFWVARMVMFSLAFLKEVPFRTVYLHGLVLDKDGRKMSKSKGTGVDPLVMTEKYGTDALRLALVIGQSAGQDFRMSEERIAYYRNFVTKLWNVGRYILAQPTTTYHLQPTTSTLSDRWIRARLAILTRDVTRHLERLDLSLAGEKLIAFLWHDFADWSVEVHKLERNTALLRDTFEQYLRLLHPFAPFVTEALWQALAPRKPKELLMVAPWPKAAALKPVVQFERWQDVIRRVRSFKLHSGLTKDEPMTVALSRGSREVPLELLNALTGLTFSVGERAELTTLRLGGVSFAFAPDRVATFTDWREREREQLVNYITQKERALTNAKLPAHVREQFADQLRDARVRLAGL